MTCAACLLPADAAGLQVSHLATWAREVLAEGESRGWLDDWSLRSQVSGLHGLSKSGGVQIKHSVWPLLLLIALY